MTPQSLPVPSQIIALAKARRLGRRPRAKEKKENPRIVRIKELAAILNLTPSRIHQLVEEGLPKKLRARYDRDECVGFYIRYLHALVEKRAILDEGGKIFASEREERLRLLRADADLREIELARDRSALVSVEDVEREMTDLNPKQQGARDVDRAAAGAGVGRRNISRDDPRKDRARAERGDALPGTQGSPRDGQE
ncbi:MAG: hypothetical protein ABSG77_04265 [Candidatus Acidiferrum sp.]|jgi:hypothetical protein